jgi:hypothetical protein
VTHEFLLSMPVMLPAVFLGRAINHRFSGSAFLRYVYCGLLLLGGMLFVEAVTQHV